VSSKADYAADPFKLGAARRGKVWWWGLGGNRTRGQLGGPVTGQFETPLGSMWAEFFRHEKNIGRQAWRRHAKSSKPFGGRALKLGTTGTLEDSIRLGFQVQKLTGGARGGSSIKFSRPACDYQRRRCPLIVVTSLTPYEQRRSQRYRRLWTFGPW